MFISRKKGGEAVSAGTYWNFETGKKVKLTEKGVLPGKPSQSFFKLPPLLILAMGAAAAHVLFFVLPQFLSQFYEASVESLVRFYVIFDYTAIALVFTGLFIAAFGDLSSRTTTVFTFGWRPNRAYLAGRRQPETVKVEGDRESNL